MKNIRPLAIYLPQFHPIPENNAAWGEGFTEWTNVKKSLPLFDGRYQPHVPHESVGYYDLRDPEVMVKQAAIAREYGIYGFAFYHYWFNGKSLLNTPVDNMHKLGKPDFPFMLIWANENWTHHWDGQDQEIIIKQDYSFEDDRRHIEYLISYFKDSRYIKIDNKPILAIYRTELFPDIYRTSIIWREVVKNNGFDDIYLIRVESLMNGINPNDIGFDAAMEFAPDWVCTRDSYTMNNIVQKFNYEWTVVNMLSKPKALYKRFKCVFPSWDNTARNNSMVFTNTSIRLFEYFVCRAISYTKENQLPEEQFFFINAWNEWAEGCHIEADVKNGYAYLEAIKRSVNKDYDGVESLNHLKYYLEITETKNYANLNEIMQLRNTIHAYKKRYLFIRRLRSFRVAKILYAIAKFDFIRAKKLIGYKL